MDPRHLLAAGALALALLLALPAAAADPGRIAFVSNRDGNSEIYVMDADGSNVTRLTNDGAADIYPAWSPDGSRIAFVSSRPKNASLHIFTMRPDGTDVARLNESLWFESDPAWSPDGTRIAFRGDSNGIWVVNADGSNPVRLTPTSGDPYVPAWSPDGARIAYANITWGPVISTTIWTIHADGTAPSPLGTVMPDSGRDGLSWSPDGTRIVYTRLGVGLRVMNADGSGDAAIPSGNPGDTFPSWSPDGTRIVFSSDGLILAMDPDGSNRTALDAGAGNNYDPAWGTTYPPAPSLVPVPPSTLPPTDTDGDGVYDDVNGNGRADFADVVLYFDALDWIADSEPIGAFDCNGNDRIDFADVTWLFNNL
jgi:TolB protein